MPEPWFGPKKYGIGIGPTSPAGWLVIVLYMLAMAVTPALVSALHDPPWVIYAVFALLTGFVVLIAILKSDKHPWRWRWGGK